VSHTIISQFVNADQRLDHVSLGDQEVRMFLSDTTNPVLCTPAVAAVAAGAAAGAVYGEVVD
jgi:hypothetical protein